MEKLQILFPEPQLARLRVLAKEEDRHVSELVRSAVDLLLSRYENSQAKPDTPRPTWHGGKILALPEQLREKAYDEESIP
jgi:Arc/MetJ-type ribon-helix-helix transcriptional regulator